MNEKQLYPKIEYTKDFIQQPYLILHYHDNQNNWVDNCGRTFGTYRKSGETEEQTEIRLLRDALMYALCYPERIPSHLFDDMREELIRREREALEADRQ